VTSSLVSGWSVELEPEVEEWLDALPAGQFGTTAFNIDRLAAQGPGLRMPHSRSLETACSSSASISDRLPNGSPSSSPAADESSS
jgi:hypothetical protein